MFGTYEPTRKVMISPTGPTLFHLCCMYVCHSVCVSVRDPCKERNGGCTQLCLSEDGRVQCSCRPGFILAEDDETCGGEESDIYRACMNLHARTRTHAHGDVSEDSVTV